MIIQIMTVTGKVVREITEDELGPIHIGRNVTSYAWDGTDEFGDRLANGVYLYRVLSEINGEEIKQRSSGADQYFKKEFGKMYLMR
jgi:flagellar hook assembly protein FlgD